MTSKQQPSTNGYVPTTDEVRADYVDHIFEYVGVPEEQVGADFDQWLNSVRAEAWDEAVASVRIHGRTERGMTAMTATVPSNPYKEAGTTDES